jgi:hypothetical protein
MHEGGGMDDGRDAVDFVDLDQRLSAYQK